MMANSWRSYQEYGVFLESFELIKRKHCVFPACVPSQDGRYRQSFWPLKQRGRYDLPEICNQNVTEMHPPLSANQLVGYLKNHRHLRKRVKV